MKSEMNLNQSQLEGISLAQAIEETGLGEPGVREILAQFGLKDANNPQLEWIPLPYAGMLLELSSDEPKQERSALVAALLEAPKSEINGHYPESNEQLVPTDDDIIGLAESTGVDLDVVMSAAVHVESLEALVQWVEAYKKLEDEQRIKDSAKQQFELDQLRKKEQELGERLNAAINKPAVNTNSIRQQLGLVVPKSVTNLGKWDGKPGSENEPDFLKNARAAFSKKK
jgi:hypothetical protein